MQMPWFSAMGCFLWLHLTSWLFFSMEVGMLMYPAPHHQPPVGASLERLFFVLFPPFPLQGTQDRMSCVYVCVSCVGAGRSWLAEHCYPVQSGHLQSMGSPCLGQCRLLSGRGVRLLPRFLLCVFSCGLPKIKLFFPPVIDIQPFSIVLKKSMIFEIMWVSDKSANYT